jgi:hypothetical protein
MAILRILHAPRSPKNEEEKKTVDCDSDDDQQTLIANEPTCKSPLVRLLQIGSLPGKTKRRSYITKRRDLPETNERRKSVEEALESALDKPVSSPRRSLFGRRRKKSADDSSPMKKFFGFATLDDCDSDDDDNDDNCTQPTCSQGSVGSAPIWPPPPPPTKKVVQVKRKSLKKQAKTKDAMQFSPSLEEARPIQPYLSHPRSQAISRYPTLSRSKSAEPKTESPPQELSTRSNSIRSLNSKRNSKKSPRTKPRSCSSVSLPVKTSPKKHSRSSSGCSVDGLSSRHYREKAPKTLQHFRSSASLDLTPSPSRAKEFNYPLSLNMTPHRTKSIPLPMKPKLYAPSDSSSAIDVRHSRLARPRHSRSSIDGMPAPSRRPRRLTRTRSPTSSVRRHRRKSEEEDVDCPRQLTQTRSPSPPVHRRCRSQSGDDVVECPRQLTQTQSPSPPVHRRCRSQSGDEVVECPRQSTQTQSPSPPVHRRCPSESEDGVVECPRQLTQTQSPSPPVHRRCRSQSEDGVVECPRQLTPTRSPSPPVHRRCRRQSEDDVVECPRQLTRSPSPVHPRCPSQSEDDVVECPRQLTRSPSPVHPRYLSESEDDVVECPRQLTLTRSPSPVHPRCPSESEDGVVECPRQLTQSQSPSPPVHRRCPSESEDGVAECPRQSRQTRNHSPPVHRRCSSQSVDIPTSRSTPALIDLDVHPLYLDLEDASEYSILLDDLTPVIHHETPSESKHEPDEPSFGASMILEDLEQEEPSSSSHNSSSIDFGLLMGHMQVLQSLEQLTKVKAAAVSSTVRYSLRDRRLRARLLLLAALEQDRLEDFQGCYQLSDPDVLTIGMHIQLCQELHEDIRWDLIFQILFPEPHYNSKIWDPLESLVAMVLEEDDLSCESSVVEESKR